MPCLSFAVMNWSALSANARAVPKGWRHGRDSKGNTRRFQAYKYEKKDGNTVNVPRHDRSLIDAQEAS